MVWQALIPAALQIIEKVIPDPAQAADAKLKALELAQRGELSALDADVRLALGQMEVNKVESATDIYRGGWRPAVGWLCASGLAYQFLLQPLLPWCAALSGAAVPPLPAIDNDTLLVLLTGMLGLGGIRSWEKVKGVAR